MPGTSEVLGKHAVWLIDLDIGGRIYRFASEKVFVANVAGDRFSYESGLSPLSIGLDNANATKSLTVTLNTGVDWALIKARGQPLELQPAVVRRIFPGQRLERATVIVRGLTESPVYSAKDDPMQIAIVRSPSRDAKLIPDANAVIDASTFPRVSTGYSIADKAEGLAYPVVLGAPGHDPTHGDPRPASPALAADFQVGLSDSTLVIADRKIAALTVLLENSTLHNFGVNVPVQSREDNLGRVYSYVDFTTAPQMLGGEGDEYWVGFQDDAVFGGGSIHRGKMVRGAGDIIRFLLEEHSNIEYDRGRFEAVADWLNKFKIDSYINARQDAWAWIESEILRWIQVVPVDGVDGLYLQPVNYGATKQDAVMWLSTEVGPRKVKRAGQLTTLREPILNEFTFEYRKPRDGAKYLDRRILTGHAYNLNQIEFYPGLQDRRIIASHLCRRSQADYDVRPWKGASGSIWDDATAGLILQGLAERYSFPKRAARYTGGLELEVLERGDVVVLDDAPVHLSEHICLVENRLVSADEISIDLLLIDHPVLTQRAT